MAGIDTQYYETYNGKKATELAFRPAMAKPELKKFFSIVEGIKGKQAVYFIENFDFATELDAGCGTGKKTFPLNITGETWAPVDLKAWFSACWTDLRGKVFEWLLKAGEAKHELDDTDYEDYLLHALSGAIYRDLLRMAWFADADMLAAVLTDPALLKFFKTFNGIWKRVFQADAAGKITVVPIAANDKAGSQIFTVGSSLPLMQDMFDAAPAELNAMPLNDRQYLVTRSIYTDYLRLRETKNLDTSFILQGDGIPSLNFRGVPIQVVDEWDIRLKAHFKVGGKIDKPHRALLTQYGNLQLGFDSVPTNGENENPLRVWNNVDTEEWNARTKYTADAQIADKKLIVAAY